MTTVGVIGLGIMGGAISANLVKRGFAVRGFDVDAAAVGRLKTNGGTPVATPAEAASGADVALTSLPSVKALEATVRALLKRPAKGLVVCELSTFTIADKEKARKALAKGGITLLDCPLSGTGSQAATGDLVVYASGDIARPRYCGPYTSRKVASDEALAVFRVLVLERHCTVGSMASRSTRAR